MDLLPGSNVYHSGVKFCFAIRRNVAIAILALLLADGCKQKNNSMSEAATDSGEAGEAVPLDPTVTRELFLKWRSPRFGTLNPQRMNNPVWEWLAKSTHIRQPNDLTDRQRWMPGQVGVSTGLVRVLTNFQMAEWCSSQASTKIP